MIGRLAIVKRTPAVLRMSSRIGYDFYLRRRIDVGIVGCPVCDGRAEKLESGAVKTQTANMEFVKVSVMRSDGST